MFSSPAWETRVGQAELRERMGQGTRRLALCIQASSTSYTSPRCSAEDRTISACLESKNSGAPRGDLELRFLLAPSALRTARCVWFGGFPGSPLAPSPPELWSASLVCCPWCWPLVHEGLYPPPFVCLSAGRGERIVLNPAIWWQDCCLLRRRGAESREVRGSPRVPFLLCGKGCNPRGTRTSHRGR